MRKLRARLAQLEWMALQERRQNPTTADRGNSRRRGERVVGDSDLYRLLATVEFHADQCGDRLVLKLTAHQAVEVLTEHFAKRKATLERELELERVYKEDARSLNRQMMAAGRSSALVDRLDEKGAQIVAIEADNARLSRELEEAKARVKSLEETENLAWDSAIEHHVAETADRKAEVARLREALAGLIWMLDERLLLRNTERDGDNYYVSRSVMFTRKLAEFTAALKAQTDE